MNGTIYQITNLSNGKKYIGQTIQEPASRRWNKHCYMARCGKQFPLYNAIRKYSVDLFKFEILEQGVESIDTLNELEEAYISSNKTTNKQFGYNLSFKAYGKGMLSNSTKEKIRTARLGTKSSEKTKHLLSISHLGRKGTCGHTGKKHTDKYKNKVRELMIGRIFSDESRAKMSKSHIGKTLSKEHRKNISKVTTGSKNPMYGKTHSTEAKTKIATAHTGKKWSEEVRKKILDSRKKFYESKKLENN